MIELDFDNSPVIIITIDTDWAPVECLQDTLSILEDFGSPATVFATTDVPYGIIEKYDVGLHPNFQEATQDEKAIQSEISRCLEKFPSAIGLRSHTLINSTRHYLVVRDVFSQIKYTSNYYMPYVDNLKPFVVQSQSFELPIYWMDHLHLEMNEDIDLGALLKIVGRPGIKVFDFHPFHVFINSSAKEHFEGAKGFYHNPDNLKKYRNTGNGVRTFLKSLLSAARKNNWVLVSCQDVIENF